MRSGERPLLWTPGTSVPLGLAFTAKKSARKTLRGSCKLKRPSNHHSKSHLLAKWVFGVAALLGPVAAPLGPTWRPQSSSAYVEYIHPNRQLHQPAAIWHGGQHKALISLYFYATVAETRPLCVRSPRNSLVNHTVSIFLAGLCSALCTWGWLAFALLKKKELFYKLKKKRRTKSRLVESFTPFDVYKKNKCLLMKGFASEWVLFKGSKTAVYHIVGCGTF